MHLAIAVSEEQTLSVQEADMAVEGMHVVGMLQEDNDAGWQQPCMPRYVLVAQMEGSWHVIEDWDRPEMKAQVLSLELG